MNKQLTNHAMMLKLTVTALEQSGIASNQDDDIYYQRLPKGRGYCHIELVGLTPYPLLIKTAYAEDFSNNQAIRYLGQLEQIPDEVLFIYAGFGWKKQSHLKVLAAIKKRLGSDHVFNLQEFETWLKTKLEEKESH
tara:strand:- start:1295 stop:1702 length:408 start_codon:yes stop_codon:yes gene_type:complete